MCSCGHPAAGQGGRGPLVHTCQMWVAHMRCTSPHCILLHPATHHAFVADVGMALAGCTTCWAHHAITYLHSAGLGAAEHLTTIDKINYSFKLSCPLKNCANNWRTGLMTVGLTLQHQPKLTPESWLGVV